ncbi:GNAT family N-acetyltransferase [Aminithiophilus ramosus]|uniref:GNAT family N-acetyltransferase n=2 Tax=Synergistales TaxID=649776 RepID=A0A9Q7AQJ9_9BACT|nr:GNAT family protein [Aminithiophilus ramosus]QTX33403.1 GNAT family N-acetyltransferase [Aminithiophilus ramosus]QVL36850.1 GNAT family N-acetyltransferase [Synergistota bacterium]
MERQRSLEGVFPEISTARLDMKALDPGQARRLNEIWTDPRVIEYMVLDPFTEMEQTCEMIETLRGLHGAGLGIRWAVCLRDGGTVLGTCGFHNWRREHHRAEIGYELDSLYWRQGFMGEAVSAALEHGFETMDLNRVEAFVTVGNRLSWGFLKKMGFTLEGTLRAYEWARGRHQDQWVFSLLREEWRREKTRP